MALIEDMFKGNLATGLAVGVGALLFGPTVIQTVGAFCGRPPRRSSRGVWFFTAKP
jgi:phosphate/sulfate permease